MFFKAVTFPPAGNSNLPNHSQLGTVTVTVEVFKF